MNRPHTRLNGGCGLLGVMKYHMILAPQGIKERIVTPEYQQDLSSIFPRTRFLELLRRATMESW